MDFLPCPTESLQVIEQLVFEARDLRTRKTVILPYRYRASRAIEIEDSFSVAPNDVNMSGPMVIRVNHHSQSPEPQHGRHQLIVT